MGVVFWKKFLNPERDSPPDFDIDIADQRRDELIQYTIQKYGFDNVKQIGTFMEVSNKTSN